MLLCILYFRVYRCCLLTNYRYLVILQAKCLRESRYCKKSIVNWHQKNLEKNEALVDCLFLLKWVNQFIQKDLNYDNHVARSPLSQEKKLKEIILCTLEIKKKWNIFCSCWVSEQQTNTFPLFFYCSYVILNR